MPKKTHPGSKPGPNRNLIVALIGAAAVVAAIVVGVLALGGGDDTVDASPAAFLDGIPQDGAILGDPDAKVTMVQFEDLQCPVCKRYTDGALEDIVEQYVRTGKAKLRFVGMSFLGEDSLKGLRYTLAAGDQQKLWQFAELLYHHQGAENSGWVSDGLLEDIATALELDWEKLKTDAVGSDVNDTIEEMSDEATKLQVGGTPTFFIEAGDDDPYIVNPPAFDIETFAPIFEDALS